MTCVQSLSGFSCNTGWCQCPLSSVMDCILPGWINDAIDDCDNGEDENCCASPGPGRKKRSFQACGADQFQCSRGLCKDPHPLGDEFSMKCDGPCMPDSWACDNFEDCTDGSDELPESCPTTTTTTSSSTTTTTTTMTTTRSFQVCGADQFQCSRGLCKDPHPLGDEFSMKCDGPCMPDSWACDNFEDCTDGSDELPESCPTTTTTTSTTTSSSTTTTTTTTPTTTTTKTTTTHTITSTTKTSTYTTTTTITITTAAAVVAATTSTFLTTITISTTKPTIVTITTPSTTSATTTTPSVAPGEKAIKTICILPLLISPS